ncbi:DNA polymerase III subunit beta [Anoxybacter fermentans]|uniref:Beta sliding clamp n=1 Tax=Anoxybacter fermentans TaxID=1323375 RepID=A0A3Q9HTY0_9FIRM|nr:DNA polymerase III subunit beta [Anoxybacter fermentans]AZR74304.1 DNA polymerase III subunit beta [Anoxybacter fermentans]
MKFIVSQKEFLEGLQTVQRAVSNKNTLPILSGVLIKAEDTQLKLVATDLEIGIECYINAKIITKGELVLPASHLSSIVRELPSMDVEVSCNLETKSAEIICGNSRFNINGFPADDFPILPKLEEGVQLTICQPLFKEVIEQVKIATSTDETQPFLNGALLKITGNELIMASTNSYRLAHRMIQLENGIDGQVEVIIPNKTLDEMVRILGDDEDSSIRIQITDNQILFEIENIIIISRLIEGRFPNYEPVIPKNSNTFIRVNRKELLQAAKRVSLIAISNSNIIKATIDNGVTILESTNSEIGHAQEKLLVNMEGPGIEISFNSVYLMDGLKVINSDEVKLCFGGKLSPLILKPVDETNYIYVISPIRS